MLVQRNRTIEAADDRAAKDAAKRLEAEARSPGGAAVNGNDRLKDFLMDWANNRPDTSKGRPPAPKTIKDDRQKCEVICQHVGNYRMSDVTANTLEDLKRKLRECKKANGQPYSDQYIKNIYAVLKKALRHAWKTDVINHDPTAKSSTPYVAKKEAPYATWTQAAEIAGHLQASRPEIAQFVIIAFTTGCRPSELAALTWDDVDLENGTIDVNKVASEASDFYDVVHFTKTALSRAVIDLPTPAVDAFKALRKMYLDTKAANMTWNPRKWVWCAARRPEVPTRPSQISCYVREGIRATGNDGIVLYSMRHGSATWLLEQGDSMKSVQDHLRHSTYKLTADTYSHVTDRMKERRVSLFDQLGTGGG